MSRKTICGERLAIAAAIDSPAENSSVLRPAPCKMSDRKRRTLSSASTTKQSGTRASLPDATASRGASLPASEIAGAAPSTWDLLIAIPTSADPGQADWRRRTDGGTLMQTGLDQIEQLPIIDHVNELVRSVSSEGLGSFCQSTTLARIISLTTQSP